jgi:hypothetical protein
MSNEELEKEWEELKEYNFGPTIDEYITYNTKYAFQDKWSGWFDEHSTRDCYNEPYVKLYKDSFLSVISEVYNDIINS